MSDRPDIFLKYMEYDGSKCQYEDKILSPEQISAIIESLRIIMSLSKASITPKKFKKLIEENKPQFVADDFIKLTEYSQIESTPDKILATISSFIRKDLDDYKKHNSPESSDYIGILSLIYGVYTFSVSNIVQSGLSMALGLYLTMPSIKRLTYSQTPVETSLGLPYIFAYGSNKPHYRKMKQLYDSIQEELNK